MHHLIMYSPQVWLDVFLIYMYITSVPQLGEPAPTVKAAMNLSRKSVYSTNQDHIWPRLNNGTPSGAKVVTNLLLKCGLSNIRLLSLSLDNSRTTWGECLGRTRWSSPLDLATYLYYFTSSCVSIITWSHVLPEHSMITWPCHIIWLPDFPCYLYLDPVIWLDVRDQLFECMGDSFLSGALITKVQ